jgi:hypothetical protein
MISVKLKNYDREINVLTRREIIEQWKLGKKVLDYPCCPNCRDLLYKALEEDGYFCGNEGCKYYYSGGDV